MTAASIDIGSNTVLMLIADINGKIIKPLKEIQRIPRISAGLHPGGEISKDSESRLMEVLQEYFLLIKKYRCDKIFISATSAFRKAINRNQIKNEIEKLFNSEIKILSGDEEAELAFLGTREYHTAGKYRLVIDIGGGSTEIIYGQDATIIYRKSLDAGVVSLSEKYFNSGSPSALKLSSAEDYIRKTFAVLPEFNPQPSDTVALAGTPAALACIKAGLSFYDENVVEGSFLARSEISAFKEFFSELSPEELLSKYPNILSGRQDLILSGTYILLIIMDLLNIDKVIVSTKGIRYGAIVKNLRMI